MREVREEASFVEARARLEPNTTKFDEQFAAVMWALSINAEFGEVVEGTKLRALKTSNLYGGNSPLIVYYEIVDDNLVTLHYIESVLEEP